MLSKKKKGAKNVLYVDVDVCASRTDLCRRSWSMWAQEVPSVLPVSGVARGWLQMRVSHGTRRETLWERYGGQTAVRGPIACSQKSSFTGALVWLWLLLWGFFFHIIKIPSSEREIKSTETERERGLTRVLPNQGEMISPVGRFTTLT